VGVAMPHQHGFTIQFIEIRKLNFILLLVICTPAQSGNLPFLRHEFIFLVKTRFSISCQEYINIAIPYLKVTSGTSFLDFVKIRSYIIKLQLKENTSI
jgi:hypothetical protein